MFVQVIEGRVVDREGLRRQLDHWTSELRPGAAGYLGTTAGVTDADHGFMLVRFESAEAASASAQRPEQTSWWAETEKCFEGQVTFTESVDVEMFFGGGSDDAGFVQVMKSSDVDRERMRVLDEAFEEQGATFRPDFLGAVRLWTGPRSSVETAYFTSEADAREGESKPAPPELAEMMSEFETMMASVEFLDLRDPWLY